MDDVVETRIPDLADIPLGDLASDEVLLAALLHALGPVPLVRAVKRVPSAGRGTPFSSSI